MLVFLSRETKGIPDVIPRQSLAYAGDSCTFSIDKIRIALGKIRSLATVSTASWLSVGEAGSLTYVASEERGRRLVTTLVKPSWTRQVCRSSDVTREISPLALPHGTKIQANNLSWRIKYTVLRIWSLGGYHRAGKRMSPRLPSKVVGLLLSLEIAGE